MSEPLDLAKFDISEEIGCMLADPTIHLPPKFKPWYDVTERIRETGMTKEKFGKLLNEMPVLDSKQLSYPEARVAHRILSQLANSYAWRYDREPLKKIPRSLAVPWVHVSDIIGVKPVLVHNDVVLANVCRKDLSKGYTADNLYVVQHVPDPEDDTFLIQIAIMEVEFAAGFKAVVSGDMCIQSNNMSGLTNNLKALAECLKKINAEFPTIYANVDPYRFVNHFLMYIPSWGGEYNPCPDGVVYEGIDDKPLTFLSFAASQSSIFQVLDAFFNIEHNADFQNHAIELREYMPRGHREFIQALENRKTAGEAVKEHQETHPELVSSYNACLEEMHWFRTFHMKSVHKMMINEGKKIGADFMQGVVMPPLKTATDATKAHKI